MQLLQRPAQPSLVRQTRVHIAKCRIELTVRSKHCFEELTKVLNHLGERNTIVVAQEAATRDHQRTPVLTTLKIEWKDALDRAGSLSSRHVDASSFGRTKCRKVLVPITGRGLFHPECSSAGLRQTGRLSQREAE
ncbi:MAG: hypothetical protein ACPHDT_16190, partial [Acidimicrobiales bacterium]